MEIRDKTGKVLWSGGSVPDNDELLKLTNGVISDFWCLDQCYVHYLGDRWEWHLGPGLMPEGPHCGGCDIG